MEKENFTENEKSPAIPARNSRDKAEESRTSLRGSQQDEEEERALMQPTLEDFCNALISYPEAPRFFLYEEEESGKQVLKAQSTKKYSFQGVSKGEDLEIVSLLRSLLYGKYPDLEIEDLFLNELQENSVPLLTAQKLKIIFERVDALERKLSQNRNIESESTLNVMAQETFLLGDQDAVITQGKEKVGIFLQEMILNTLKESSLAHYEEEKNALKKYELRRFIEPPITSFHEIEWLQWATCLIQEGKGDVTQTNLLADYGLSDPLWTINQIKIALAKAALPEEFYEELVTRQRAMRLPKYYSSKNLTHEQLPRQKKLPFAQGGAVVEDQQETTFPEPPLILNKTQEVIGKALLHQARTLLQIPTHSLEEQSSPSISIIKKPSEEDLNRWKVYQECKRLEEERDRLLAQIRECSAPLIYQSPSSKIFRFASPFCSPEEELALSSQKAVAENDNESTTTTASKKDKQSGSIYSKTTASTKSSKSDLSTAEEKLLKPINRELTKRADQWIKLVLQADVKRKSDGGLAYSHNEAFFTAWEQADEQGQRYQQEQERLQEELATQERLKENWEANTRRWEARNKADVIASEQELLEIEPLSFSEEVQKTEEEWATLAFPVILHRLTEEGLLENKKVETTPFRKLMTPAVQRYQLSLRQKELQKELIKNKAIQRGIEERRDHQNRLWQEEYQENKAFRSSLKKLFKKYQISLEKVDQTLKELTSSAEVTAPDQASSSLKEKFVKATINQLKQDQSINERWRSFSNPSSIEQEEEALNKETLSAQEQGIHQVELAENITNFTEYCFEKVIEVEQKLQVAYEKYCCSPDTQQREEIKHLCTEVDQREAEGEQNYLEAIEAYALQDARKQGMQALPVWETYLKKSQRAPLSLTSLPALKETATISSSPIEANSSENKYRTPIDPISESHSKGQEEPTQEQIESDAKEYITQRLTLEVALAEKQKLEAKKEGHLFAQQFEEKYSNSARSAQRTRAIIHANHKAWEALQKAAKEYHDIETIWKTQREEEERHDTLRFLTAAHEYFQNNKLAWNLLTRQERQRYNDVICEANEIKEEAIQEGILRAKKDLQIAESKNGNQEQEIKHPTDIIKNRFNKFSWDIKSPSYKETIYQQIKKAKEHLIQLWTIEDERQRALKWATLTPSERVAEIKKGPAFDFYNHAQQLERWKGSRYYQRENLTTFSKEEVVNYWNEVVGRVDQLAAAWAQALESNLQGKGLILPPRDIESVHIEEEVHFWNLELLRCKVSQAAAIAQQAQEKLLTASPAERASLWRESLRTAQEAEEAFKKAYANHETYVETSLSVTDPETQWAHWIAIGDSLIIDDSRGKDLLETAVSSLTQAASQKTETAWREAQQCSQALLTFLNKQKENTALLKIQKAIWKQKVKFAAAKASFAKAKYQWEPISQALQNYINHPEAGVNTLDLAMLKKAENSLREALQATATLSHNHLSTGENMAVVATTAASGLAGTVGGAVVGAGAFVAALPATILGTPGLVGYTAYQASTTATTPGEAARAMGISTSALVGGAFVLATAPVGALTSAVLNPLIGASLFGPRAAKRTFEDGYENVYASQRSAEVVRNTLDAQTLASIMEASLKALHSSFPRSYMRTLATPNTAEVHQAIEGTAQVQEMIMQAQGTAWEEEAAWLTEITGEAAAFAIAAEARKK